MIPNEISAQIRGHHTYFHHNTKAASSGLKMMFPVKLTINPPIADVNSQNQTTILSHQLTAKSANQMRACEAPRDVFLRRCYPNFTPNSPNLSTLFVYI
jgi:hypothetical protein